MAVGRHKPAGEQCQHDDRMNKKKGSTLQRIASLPRRYLIIALIGVLTLMIYLLSVPGGSNQILGNEDQLFADPQKPVLRFPEDDPSLPSEATLEWESHRRQMEANMQTLLLLSNSKVNQTLGALATVMGTVDNATNTTDQFQDIKKSLQNYSVTMATKLRAFLQTLKALDKKVSTWRESQLRKLNKIAQEKIYKVMNPENCNDKKKFFCDFGWVCGFGCTLHHILYCATMSIKYDRPLILMDENWNYGRWETFFKPISSTCHNVTVEDSPVWNGDPSVHHAKLTHLDKVKYDPMKTIPEDLGSELVRLHGNPLAWWVGQLMKYLLRPTTTLSNFTSEVVKRTRFSHPVVGLHVRRTDKVDEAKYYHIRHYMKVAEGYFDWREITEKIDRRRVYIATDDPQVVVKARNLYPHYDILSDSTVVSGAEEKTRFSSEGLKTVVADLQILSDCDFVVCTFSSNIGRAVYELMQTKNVDAALNCRSLDMSYFFG